MAWAPPRNSLFAVVYARPYPENEPSAVLRRPAQAFQRVVYVQAFCSRQLRCVLGEDKIASFFLRVAGEAGLHQGLGTRLAVRTEVTKPPATRRSILL